MFKKLSKFVLDLFFPKSCLGCKKTNTYLCQDCFNKIELCSNNICFFCHRPSWQGQNCIICKNKFSLDRVISATEYKHPLIQEIIKNFKYNYVKELYYPLAQLLIKSLKNAPNISNDSNIILVPIPLHKRRLHERNFNQAELLAKEISQNFSIPMETKILKRKRAILAQAKIKDRESRKENIKDVFEIDKEFMKKCVAENENLLKDKIIILVDDVATTGATLSEAAKVLKRAGAKEVWGLVVAKG
jgi:ComF family protein